MNWSYFEENKEKLGNNRKLYLSIKTEFLNKIKQFFLKEKYKILGAGNYSYFHVLPQCVSFIRKIDPYSNYYFKLSENFVEEFKTNNFEFLIASDNDISKDQNIYSRKIFKDDSYFSVSENLYQKYKNNSKNVLKKSELISARFYTDSSLSELVSYQMRYIPKERKESVFKITVDLFFLAHQLMKENFGLWIYFQSSLYDKKIKSLEYFNSINRRCIYKRNPKNTIINNFIIRKMESNKKIRIEK